MARRRNKIRYCYQDYMNHISEKEKLHYQEQHGPLIDIISCNESDREIMELAKEYDSKNNTDIFNEAVRLTTYCIACHKIDCTC